MPGDAGGTKQDDTDIVGLNLAPGQASMCYDFYIMPPASLTGRVMINITGLACNEATPCPAWPTSRSTCSRQRADRGLDHHRRRRRLRVQQLDARAWPTACKRSCRPITSPRTRCPATPGERPATPRISWAWSLRRGRRDVLRLLHHAAGEPDRPGDGQSDRIELRRKLDLARRAQRHGQLAECLRANRGHHGDRFQRRLRIRQSDAWAVQRPGIASRPAILPRTPRPAMPVARPRTPRTSSG